MEVLSEMPCTHEHTEDCYSLVEDCVHEHTEECFLEDEDETATPSDAREALACPHVCSEEEGCIKWELDCFHEHDEACGYRETVEGETDESELDVDLDAPPSDLESEQLKNEEVLAAALEMTKLRAVDIDTIDWENVQTGGTIRVDSAEYTYKGDYSETSLNLDSDDFSSENCIFRAGEGYILWKYGTKTVSL